MALGRMGVGRAGDGTCKQHKDGRCLGTFPRDIEKERGKERERRKRKERESKKKGETTQYKVLLTLWFST